MAFAAIVSTCPVTLVVEPNEIGKIINSHPMDRFPSSIMIYNLPDGMEIRSYPAVTEHAFLHRR